ncbi:hypothetical protein ACFL6S_01020 [Candidatus Poribacteria bacterium]
MRKMSFRALFVMLTALLQILLSPYAVAEEKTPEQVSVDVHIRAEWLLLSLSVSEGDSSSRTMTRSALRVLRAIGPENGKPYDESEDVFDCNPAELRRSFRLEKEEYLLGEPLLVEFRIELDGPGQWRERIGGNYRARGRDDNFLFLMRHEDGSWVRDPYAPIEHYMGGISSLYEVRQDKAQSYWLAVQRWCAVDRPGAYDLYCFQMAHDSQVLGENQAIAAKLPDLVKRDHRYSEDGILIDSGTGKRSERYSIATYWTRRNWDSPLMQDIPADVVKYARESWGIQQVMDFAHFRIALRNGTEQERQRMVDYWTDIAESEAERNAPQTRWGAAIYAIQFAQQDDFIPLIEEWIASGFQYMAYSGLAMRPGPGIADILLKSGEPNAVAAMRFLRPNQVHAVIPQLIKRLTHKDNRMRAEAEQRLRTWTGRSFYHTWRGYHYERPTLEEGRKMQPVWEEWWEKNKDSFKPRTRYDEKR